MDAARAWLNDWQRHHTCIPAHARAVIANDSWQAIPRLVFRTVKNRTQLRPQLSLYAASWRQGAE